MNRANTIIINETNLNRWVCKYGEVYQVRVSCVCYVEDNLFLILEIFASYIDTPSEKIKDRRTTSCQYEGCGILELGTLLHKNKDLITKVSFGLITIGNNIYSSIFKKQYLRITVCQDLVTDVPSAYLKHKYFIFLTTFMYL